MALSRTELKRANFASAEDRIEIEPLLAYFNNNDTTSEARILAGQLELLKNHIETTQPNYMWS